MTTQLSHPAFVTPGELETLDEGQLLDPAQRLYLWTMERVLNRLGFGERPRREPFPRVSGLDEHSREVIERVIAGAGLELVATRDAEGARLASKLRGLGQVVPDGGEAALLEASRSQGMDWPPEAETMLGLPRLHNFAVSVARAVCEGVEGDIVEAGIWRGGACILARGMLEAMGDRARRVFVCDSFEGLPPPDPKYPADAGDRHHTFEDLKVSLEDVRANFARYNLLDDRVVFVKGWFKDTMPSLGTERIAVLRVDGDMYGSTMEVLEPLYDRVSPGGWVIVDDFGLAGCRLATLDFRRQRGITEPMAQLDWTGVYWRKGVAG
jgi:hypothetical protein